jgi:hypothetical protein
VVFLQHFPFKRISPGLQTFSKKTIANLPAVAILPALFTSTAGESEGLNL